MRRCAFVTMDNREGWVIDDDRTHAPLLAVGWSVDEVSWRADVDWGQFEVVVVRSPWDYMHDLKGFLASLKRIDESKAILHNSLELIRWNSHKSYLKDLDARGVPIVPTVWTQSMSAGEGAELFGRVGSDSIVVKPTVGGGAYDTFLVNEGDELQQVETVFAEREAMVQPVVDAIISEGEYSLFYFNGEFSHAVLKTPKAKDFRVQEEHGGIITLVQPDDSLHAAGNKAMAALSEVPLYARVDLVRQNGGEGFWLIEFELIEPSLYFRMDEASGARFAQALAARHA